MPFIDNLLENFPNHHRYATKTAYNRYHRNRRGGSRWDREFSSKGNSDTRPSGRYFIDNRVNSYQQPNTTPGPEISFDPEQFVTSTAVRPRPDGANWHHTRSNHSANWHHTRSNHSANWHPGTPKSSSGRQHSLSTRPKISSDRGPHLPSQPSPSGSIVIDRTGNSVVDDVSYTPVPSTLRPKSPHRNCISTTSSVKDTSRGDSSVRSHDSNRNLTNGTNGHASKPPKSGDPIEKDIATQVDCVRSEKKCSVEFDNSPGPSDIPCGQGDNTNTPPTCGLDFQSFFSQVPPPSLPPRIGNMPSAGASKNNGGRAADEANLEPYKDGAELSSTLKVLSPGRLNSQFFAQLVAGSPTTGNVLRLKGEVQDIIPSSQAAVSLKPNFNASKRLFNSLSAHDDSISKRAKEIPLDDGTSIKHSPRDMPACPMNVRRPLHLCLNAETVADQYSAIQRNRVPDPNNSFLNFTKPLDLCSQATCDSLFNDVQSNPTQNLTLSNTGEMPVQESLPAENPGSPAPAGDGDLQCINVAVNIPADESSNAPLDRKVKPFLNEECNDVSKHTVNNVPQPAISSGFQALLPQKHRLKSHQDLFRPTKTNLVQTASDWQSFQDKVDWIACDIHAILTEKLKQLNESNADTLVFDLNIAELQGDTCERNATTYSYRIENRKKFTMQIINHKDPVTPPSKPSQASAAVHCSEDCVRTPKDTEGSRPKKRKKRSTNDFPIPETSDSISNSGIPHKSKKRIKSAPSADVDDSHSAKKPQRTEATGKKAKQKRIQPEPSPEPVVECAKKREKKIKSHIIIEDDAHVPKTLPGKLKKEHKRKKERKSESYADEIVNDSCDSRTKDNTERTYDMVKNDLKEYRKLFRSKIKSLSSQVKDYHSDTQSESKK